MMNTIFVQPLSVAQIDIYKAIEKLLSEKVISPTTNEIASRSGYSYRWTSLILQELAKLGVIHKNFYKKRSISLSPTHKLVTKVGQRDVVEVNH